MCHTADGDSARRTTMNALPAEVEQGNVEYKLQLLHPTADRFQHLVTQLNWRLNEGHGYAFYELGVADDGMVVGMPPHDLETSLNTLCRMCQVLSAEMQVHTVRPGTSDTYKAARVAISRIAETHAKKQVRVSVIGDFDSGKSTLIGVLTRGCLDDGNGLARMQVLRHLHEIEDGRTSSISEQILGKICKFSSLESRNASSIDAQSTKLIMFSDLAGHQRYLKITASGLTSQFPDYAMLVVDATTGVQPMTLEHLRIVLGLGIRVFVVVTKVDLAAHSRIEQTVDGIHSTLSMLHQPPPRVIATADDLAAYQVLQDAVPIPVFHVSNVTGTNMALLQQFLASIHPTREWTSVRHCSCEFHISGHFPSDDVGTIVTGLVQSGTVHVGESLLLGPTNSGAFYGVHVKSIEVQRTPAKCVFAGQTAALLVTSLDHDDIEMASMRRGMMLVHPNLSPIATRQFDAQVHVLNASMLLKENIQGVVHAGPIQQLAKVVAVFDEGDGGDQRQVRLRFEFIHSPEYMRPDWPLVFREANTHAVGKVLHAVHALNSDLVVASLA
ncbi:hypothetical protein, variant [Aphanomyces invadans]|uniref:Elongation factor Tu, chloroplastic n=1 Tax=Aphanomyces invadans TaxID=157072 RepID=A0A024UM71_9STRA|nr:hypothetical protein, variant [Aphanomyces invadans]ETW06927.1 hypothetical protein, variant [Aphanomyces invadans]|eukprot:XP_008865002.1 hypothetical protein, variant [Aphanomyces invadans]